MIDPKLIHPDNWEAHYLKRGDPTKSTYYIIRRDRGVGLFSNFVSSAGHIRYALVNGWLPVIDMQNFPNPYLPPEKLGKENSWEYYFHQPLRIGVEQAYNGENIILSQLGILAPCPNDGMSFFENKNGTLTEWRMIVKWGLLRIKDNFVKEAQMIREKLFSPNDRVLGVNLRGTDYISLRPKNHPIPPPVEFSASTVVAKLREWNCNKIFLTCEDKNIVENFKNIFGDICVTTDRKYINYKPGDGTPITRINRENDHFLQGKEYLTDILLLSMCDCLVLQRCTASVAVMLLSDHFEDVFVFNLGRWGVVTLE